MKKKNQSRDSKTIVTINKANWRNISVCNMNHAQSLLYIIRKCHQSRDRCVNRGNTGFMEYKVMMPWKVEKEISIKRKRKRRRIIIIYKEFHKNIRPEEKGNLPSSCSYNSSFKQNPNSLRIVHVITRKYNRFSTIKHLELIFFQGGAKRGILQIKY